MFAGRIVHYVLLYLFNIVLVYSMDASQLFALLGVAETQGHGDTETTQRLFYNEVHGGHEDGFIII
jgi:hypothetical protein